MTSQTELANTEDNLQGPVYNLRMAAAENNMTISASKTKNRTFKCSGHVQKSLSIMK
jgi:hypothetical protein